MNQEIPPDPALDAGVLVRRMGHDFNNLFSIVLGGLSLLREEIHPSAWSQDSCEVYDDIVSATHEATDVVARLTAWAGRQALEPESVDLHDLARDAAAHARGTLAPQVTLTVHTDTPAAVAWADRAHLRNAILELVANAAGAIDGAGEIRIEVTGGDAAVIDVVDTGTGMTREVLHACREPYFSTRRDDGRRGLGLAVVDGFSRASRSTLRIDSEPGRGTRVSLTLPARPPGAS